MKTPNQKLLIFPSIVLDLLKSKETLTSKMSVFGGALNMIGSFNDRHIHILINKIHQQNIKK